MKNKWLKITKLAVGELAVLFVLVAILLWQYEFLNTEVFVALVTATVGWFVGVWYVYVSASEKTKIDLGLKASNEVIQEITAYSAALGALNVHIRYPLKSPPRPIPRNYWYDKAHEFHESMGNLHLDLLKRQTDLRYAIERNEVAIIPLQSYYHYTMSKHEEITQLLLEANSKFLSKLRTSMTELDYDEALTEYKLVADACFDLECLNFDLTKEILNYFQSSLFGRTLEPRRPSDGTKTLSQLVAKEQSRRK